MRGDDEQVHVDIGLRVVRWTPTPCVRQSNMFRATAKFFGQKTAAKNEKKICFLNSKIEFISSSEIECPISLFVTNYWVSLSGKE